MTDICIRFHPVLDAGSAEAPTFLWVGGIDVDLRQGKDALFTLHALQSFKDVVGRFLHLRCVAFVFDAPQVDRLLSYAAQKHA